MIYVIKGFRYFIKRYNAWVIYDIYSQKTKFDFYRYIATYIVFESSVIFYSLSCFYKPINGVLRDLLLLPLIIPLLYIICLRLFSKFSIYLIFPICLYALILFTIDWI